MKASLPNDHFFSLCDARDEDANQDQYLALLEGQPQSEADARAILKTLHHRHERARRNRRKRGIQLDFDPPAPQQDDEDGTLVSALELLSSPDQEIIRAHVIDEVPLPEIASRLGISRKTAWQRFTHAKKKLAALHEKQVTQPLEKCRMDRDIYHFPPQQSPLPPAVITAPPQWS